MRITQWGEYGIHFSVMIAQMERNGHIPVGAEKIAKTQKVDINYTQQILQRLRKNGIVKSVRGPLGGYKLAKPAEDITLLDIILATEGNSLDVKCNSHSINHNRCTNPSNCALSQLWAALKDKIDSFLRSYTLSEFANNFNHEYSKNA